MALFWVVSFLSSTVFLPMKKIGKTDPQWSIQKAISDQVEREAWQDWAQKPVSQRKSSYVRQEFHLTEAAKHAFTRGINLFKL